MVFGSPIGPMPLSMGIDLATTAYSGIKSGIRKLSRKNNNYADPLSFSISGIVPAYNGERDLEHTVRSLYGQTIPLKNVIVVDDASTDRTMDVAARLGEEFGDRFIYLRREVNSGKAANLNFATRDSRVGEIMYVLDCDCEAKPDAVEKLVRNFNDDKVGAVTSFGYTLPPNNWLARQFHHGREWNNSLFRFRKKAQADRGAMFVVCGASTAFRTEAIREVPFRSITKTEDTDETWRLQEHGFKVLYDGESHAFSTDLEQFGKMRSQSQRWYSGTFQNLFVHGKEIRNAKSLLLTTIVPGTIDAVIGTVSYVAFPFIAGAELSGVVDVPVFTNHTIAYAAAADLALTAVPTLALEPKRIAHLPQIYGYRTVGSFLTLKAAAKTAFEKLTGKESNWSNRWGRDYVTDSELIQGISREYLEKNMKSFDSLEHIWEGLGERPWAAENYLLDLPGKWDLSLSAHKDNRLVGYLIGSQATPGRARINKILADPSTRGQGTKLIERFEQRCIENGLVEVELKALVENDAANRFYAKHGYEVVGEVEGDDGRMRFLYLKQLVRGMNSPSADANISSQPVTAASPYLFRSALDEHPEDIESIVENEFFQASRSFGIKSADLSYAANRFRKSKTFNGLIESLNGSYGIDKTDEKQIGLYSVASAIERIACLEKSTRLGKGIKEFMHDVVDIYNNAIDSGGKRLTNEQIAAAINDNLIDSGYSGKAFQTRELNKYLHLAENLIGEKVDWKRRRTAQSLDVLSEERLLPRSASFLSKLSYAASATILGAVAGTSFIHSNPVQK